MSRSGFTGYGVESRVSVHVSDACERIANKIRGLFCERRCMLQLIYVERRNFLPVGARIV